MDGDETMRAFHDKRSPKSLQEKEQAAAADMRAMMEDALGQQIAPDESLDSLDAVMRAGMAQVQAAQQAEQARRQAPGGAGQQKTDGSPTQGRGTAGRRRDHFAQGVPATGQRPAPRPRA
ncbi:hypothetical protein [Polaromonas sp.]|uniref:hypothetical protein n=1 Tax=Polaromonas sp. TaxID=1869339 RepID=UPI0025E6AFAF|nr:hypothetical protein [Polaromonas sp.]